MRRRRGYQLAGLERQRRGAAGHHHGEPRHRLPHALVRGDINLLKGYRFHYVVLDESQAIKNPVAQTSRAARQLQSEHRLVMTGTPVENSTSDLWSQFAFINPGMLGSIDYFREEFANPIERKGDAEQAQVLRRMIFPFILRRTKDQVAPELPERTERIIYTNMETGQRKMYHRTRDYYRGMLMGLLNDGKQMEDVRFKILEGLLRLRQICNHPMLIDRDFHGDSGKFELLVETLETLRSEGHKVLVFSQFVEMLKLLRRHYGPSEVSLRAIAGRSHAANALAAYFDGQLEAISEILTAAERAQITAALAGVDRYTRARIGSSLGSPSPTRSSARPPTPSRTRNRPSTSSSTSASAFTAAPNAARLRACAGVHGSRGRI